MRAESDTAARRDAVVAHVKASVGRLAGEMHDVDAGWLVRTPDLPLVWTLNQLHLTVAGDADLVVSMAERHQGAMAYRHVVVDDDATGASAASSLAGSWTVAREVLMVLDAQPSGGRVAVEDLGEDDMVALMRRWLAEDHPDMSEAGYAQMEQYHRRDGRLWHERRLGARDGRGAPAAIAKLRMDGTTAWVEDVYTAPEMRRRGLARTLVSYAAWLGRASGHGLVYLLADDDDWPKDLYAEIGFRMVGRRWVFHRAGALM